MRWAKAPGVRRVHAGARSRGKSAQRRPGPGSQPLQSQAGGVPRFVLSQCVTTGVEALASEKVSPPLKLKYNIAIPDAVADLGSPAEIGKVCARFQKCLYIRARRRVHGHRRSMTTLMPLIPFDRNTASPYF